MNWMTRWSLGLLVCFVGLGAVACEGRVPPPRPNTGWKFVNPLIEVEMGEWAVYDLIDDKTWRMEVIDDGGQGPKVMIQNRRHMKDLGELVLANEQTLHRNHILNGYQSAGWIVGKMYHDNLDVAGRNWDALCVEYLTRDGVQYKVWYSQDVPGYGLLKQVAIRRSEPDMVNAVLVDWSSRSEE